MLEDDTHFTKLGRAANKVHSLKLGCEFRKPAKHLREEVHNGRYDRTFEWLAEIVDGLWVVRLVEDNVVDHCVAINADTKLIFDSEEFHPLKLTKDSLKFCGGPRARNLRVAEVMLLVKAK